ncbi:unnamed protein product [Rangifer tarandus platyrhynchus]|uniref:Uncharacterized protein n=1 Tax=Rangifer tarandus platyrhynchus TaxID=3082113 RepID=A0ABN8YSB0_RANTA|nr:unnamed protein product [Rangifer tarandus platyrhynchus]
MCCACASGPSSRLHRRACGPQAETRPVNQGAWGQAHGASDLEPDWETVGAGDITLGDYVWGAVAIPLSWGADSRVVENEEHRGRDHSSAGLGAEAVRRQNPAGVTMPS